MKVKKITIEYFEKVPSVEISPNEYDVTVVQKYLEEPIIFVDDADGFIGVNNPRDYIAYIVLHPEKITPETIQATITFQP